MLAKGSALPRSGPVVDKLTALEAYQAGRLALPPGYDLEHGAKVEVLLLRRGDGSVVAAFSAKGATPATVTRTAEEDHRQNPRRRRTARPTPPRPSGPILAPLSE